MTEQGSGVETETRKRGARAVLWLRELARELDYSKYPAAADVCVVVLEAAESAWRKLKLHNFYRKVTLPLNVQCNVKDRAYVLKRSVHPSFHSFTRMNVQCASGAGAVFPNYACHLLR